MMAKHPFGRVVTATVALVGFSLSSVSPRTARASGTSSTTSTTSMTSSLGNATVSILTASLFLLSVIVVLLIVLVVKKHGKTQAGDRAGALLHGGLLSSRTDLSVHLGVLLENPAMQDQITDEITRGGGPGLDAFARATGLATDDVAARWGEAATRVGPVASRADAGRFVGEFLHELTPSLNLPPDTVGNYLWELRREQLGASVQRTTHHATARWLGVPATAIAQATESVFADLDGLDEGAMREQLRGDSARYIGAIAAQVETQHRAEIDQRLGCMIDASQAWLPGGMMESLRADLEISACAS